MKLNNYTEYAFRILLYLLMHKDEKTKIQNIADYFGLSANHLNKVVQNLAKNELVVTTRGKNGGLEISEKGEEITVDQLIKLLEPREELAPCLGAKNLVRCRLSGDCKLRVVFGEASQLFYKHLSQFKIKDLL